MLEYITYKKEKYPVRVLYRALVGFEQETGIDFNELTTGGQKMELKHWEPLLYFSLISGHKAVEKEMPFKREDMPDLLDECFFEFVRIVPKFMPKEEDIEQGKKEPNRQQRRLEKRSK